jgi:glutathione S-transferase
LPALIGPWLLADLFTVADVYLAADLRIAQIGNLIPGDVQPFAGYFKRIGVVPLSSAHWKSTRSE